MVKMANAAPQHSHSLAPGASDVRYANRAPSRRPVQSAGWAACYGPFKYVRSCIPEIFPSVTGKDACPHTKTGFSIEPFDLYSQARYVPPWSTTMVVNS